MSTYKATFIATAQVQIEIEVEGSNQQEGLVQSYDDVKLADPSKWRILSVDTEKAVNTCFKWIEGAPVAPEHKVTGKTTKPYELLLYHAWVEAPAAVRLEFVDSEIAKQAAVSAVSGENSTYGQAIVRDTESNVTVHALKNERGGFEFQAFDAEGVLQGGASWLSEKEATSMAVKASLKEGIKVCRVIDYTDRSRGPVLKREIK